MSMTKRYIESLPQEEQDAILGGPEDGEQPYPDAEFEAYWATVEADNKRRADESEEEWFALWLAQVEGTAND